MNAPHKAAGPRVAPSREPDRPFRAASPDRRSGPMNAPHKPADLPVALGREPNRPFRGAWAERG
jgi:hypothetical protein